MMEIATSFDQLALDKPALLTIGTFDGVHRGHRFLLEQAQERSQEHGFGLVIVTFDPCPAVVLRPGLHRYQLTTAAQKLRLLGAIGPAAVLLLPFTPELSRLTAGEFMDRLEANLALRELWLGEDFHFGRDRAGGLPMLVERGRESGFSLHVVSRRMEDSASISSTRVRQALAAGEVRAAIPLLGYPFSLDVAACSVTDQQDAGDGAAFLSVPSYLAMPAAGTYAVLLTGNERAGDAGRVAVAAITGPDDPVRLWPYSAAGEVAFIERLATEPLAEHAGDAALAEAQRRLAGWRPPAYPAAGNY